MHSVERTPDNPPPPSCPTCGGRPTSSTVVKYTDQKVGIVEQFHICSDGHLFSMRWVAA